MKTGMKKVLGRDSYEVRNYYNRTGKRDKDGKVIFEVLTLLDFTSKSANSRTGRQAKCAIIKQVDDGSI